MSGYIIDENKNLLNDAETRINLYADWLSLYMALISGVSGAITMQSRCLSYY